MAVACSRGENRPWKADVGIPEVHYEEDGVHGDNSAQLTGWNGAGQGK